MWVNVSSCFLPYSNLGGGSSNPTPHTTSAPKPQALH